MSTQNTRRVVVTGRGVVSSIGIGEQDFWSSIKQGKCGIEQAKTYDIEDLQIKIAGEVKDFDPKEQGLSKQFLMADRYSQFAGIASRQAVEQSASTWRKGTPARCAPRCRSRPAPRGPGSIES